MTTSEDPDHRGGIAIRMTAWSGRQSGTRFFPSWPAALRFLRSEEFALMGDIRLLTVKQARRTGQRFAPGGSHWRPSPQERPALEDRARREFGCRSCGALPGSPCTGPVAGREVCGPRYIDVLKAVRSEARAAIERSGP
jgi:hypothetical protein